MDSPPHSTVTSKPRTLPACFFSASLLRVKPEDISSKSVGNVIKSEETPEILPDTVLKYDSGLNEIDETPSSNDATLSSSVGLVNDEVKTEEIPLEECDTDVDSSSESKPVTESLPTDSVNVSSTETLPPVVTSSVIDDLSPPVSSSDNVSAGNSLPEKRPTCRYGTSCYRRNPQHKSEFSHPGDDDYEDAVPCTSSTDVSTNTNKPACWYGTRCYRKNKEHLEQFSHSFSSTGRPKRTTKIRVEIGVDCDTDESEELEDFHTDSDEYEASFIDDDASSDDEIDSADEEVPEMSDGSVTSEDEEDKKRKKKLSKKIRKKKL